MITVLQKKSHRLYEVKLLRNARSSSRKGDGSHNVYLDQYVRIDEFTETGRKKPVGYHFQFRGHKTLENNPPYTSGDFWVAVFYRKPNPEYLGREFNIAFNNPYIRLLKYGKENPDYVFLILCPHRHIRVGDKRFSTIASPHTIEKEQVEIDLELEALEVKDE